MNLPLPLCVILFLNCICINILELVLTWSLYGCYSVYLSLCKMVAHSTLFSSLECFTRFFLWSHLVQLHTFIRVPNF